MVALLWQRMLRLQQQQSAALTVDRVYDDRLSDPIPEELWTRNPGELQEQLRRVRAELERHDRASQAYETGGLQILELARSAHTSDIRKDPDEQAPMKTFVSNSTFSPDGPANRVNTGICSAEAGSTWARPIVEQNGWPDGQHASQRHTLMGKIRDLTTVLSCREKLSGLFLSAPEGTACAAPWRRVSDGERVGMRCRFRTAIVVASVWLSVATAAWADSITYRFEGRIDDTTGIVPPSVGDVMFGSISFVVPGIDAPPGASSGTFQTREDVFHVSFAHEPGGPVFAERTFHDQLSTVSTFNNFFGDRGGPFDELEVTLSTFTFPQFNFNIDLVDLTGSVFGANANLPSSPHLDAFQLRNFVANIETRHGGGQSIVGTFDGRITSLVGSSGPFSPTPEPSSLLLLGPVALGILGRATIKSRSLF